MISNLSSVPVSVNTGPLADAGPPSGSPPADIHVITLPPDTISPPLKETSHAVTAKDDGFGRGLAIASLVLLATGAAATVAVIVARARARAAAREAAGIKPSEGTRPAPVPDVPLPPTYAMPH